MADRAFKIDEGGHLKPIEPRGEKTPTEDITMAPEATDEINAPDDQSHSAHLTKRKEEVSVHSRPNATSDSKVYATYFRSIGSNNVVIFFVFGIAFAFCLRFPGSYDLTWYPATCQC
jgi:hypothetical protein